jgi:mannose-1-phosphate guanylyltransferase
MIKSTQLAIIQAFTALRKKKFEQMVVILNFRQKTKKKIMFVIKVSNAALNLKKQMIIQFIIYPKFEILGYEKLTE